MKNVLKISTAHVEAVYNMLKKASLQRDLFDMYPWDCMDTRLMPCGMEHDFGWEAKSITTCNLFCVGMVKDVDIIQQEILLYPRIGPAWDLSFITQEVFSVDTGEYDPRFFSGIVDHKVLTMNSISEKEVEDWITLMKLKY